MKHVHVHQNRIRANIRRPREQRDPPITVRQGSRRTYANTVEIKGPCRVVYSPDKPLSCGARVWIEVADDIEVAASV